MAGKYRYQPLPSGRHFRLLHLFGRVGEHFHCGLRTYEVDKAPAYYGLSYCWGSVRDKVAMICNGRSLRTSLGLAEALDYLYDFMREEDVDFLWIDQICVDQNNLSERSQVRLMRDIYGGGRRTLIWLGPYDQSNDPKALALLERIDRARISSGYDPDDGPLPRITAAECKQLGLPKLKSTKWKRLDRFFGKPWFTRVWVIQEAAMSRDDPLLLWGSIVLDRASVAASISFLLTRSVFKQMRRSPSWNAMERFDLVELIREQRDEHTGRPNPWTLNAILNSTAGGAAYATDSRD